MFERAGDGCSDNGDFGGDGDEWSGEAGETSGENGMVAVPRQVEKVDIAYARAAKQVYYVPLLFRFSRKW